MSKANEVDGVVMRHWKLDGKTITLAANDRVVSIEKKSEESFMIGECCDDWFAQDYSKQEIIELLTEALRFVQSTDA